LVNLLRSDLVLGKAQGRRGNEEGGGEDGESWFHEVSWFVARDTFETGKSLRLFSQRMG
jgi:hypothetical protein